MGQRSRPVHVCMYPRDLPTSIRTMCPREAHLGNGWSGCTTFVGGPQCRAAGTLVLPRSLSILRGTSQRSLQRSDREKEYSMDSAAPQRATPKRRPKTVGFGFWSVDAAQSIDTIVTAEMAGLDQIWLTQAPNAPDSLTVFAAAVSRTHQIRVGTAITQTYPRHPLVLAQQAL